MRAFKQILLLLRDTFQEWQRENSPMLAAGLAYYAVFSMAPLLAISISIAGLLFDELLAQDLILANISQVAGPQVSEIAATALATTHSPLRGNLPTIITIGALIYTASILFVKLKQAINLLWGIAPDPQRGVLPTLWTQVRSVLLVFGLGLLLMLLMALNTMLAVLNQMLAALPQVGEMINHLPQADFWMVLLASTLFFGIVFKTLPDAKISWRDVSLGAFVTGLLFAAGEAVIRYYIRHTSIGSAFGAASSMIVILVWVYYSMQIILFGAKFTHLFAHRHGHGLQPTRLAVEVVRAYKNCNHNQTGV